MRGRLVIVAAILSLIVSGGLAVRILAIHKPGVLVIIVPAAFGAVLALWRSESAAAIGLACVLMAATAVVSLIGGVGLLYVPALVLLLSALFRAPSATMDGPHPDR